MRFSFSSNLIRDLLIMDYFDQAIRGLSVGILVAFLLLYVFRPREPYPRWTLTPFEQPWMFAIIFLVLIMTFQWDLLIGILLTLCLVGIFLDVRVYGKHYVPKDLNSPLRTSAKEASLPLIAGVAPSFSVVSGEPLSKTDIQADLPTPKYPMFAGMYGPQPGEPSLFD